MSDFDSIFLYEVLCNDFPTVDTPRRPCYHSPNEKSKNTRGKTDDLLSHKLGFCCIMGKNFCFGIFNSRVA